MTDTVFSGPLIVYGQSPFAGAEYNPDLGSSLVWGGIAILDPRLPFSYIPGESQSAPDIGWWGIGDVMTLAAVPYTKATGAIVASANPTGPTLTLVSANSATTGVYITTTLTRSDTGVLDTNGGLGLVALDALTSVTASFSNGVMTVTANSAMPITPGMVVVSTGGSVTAGTAAGTIINSQLTATGTYTSTGMGTTGTYQTNSSNLTATSGTVTLALPNPYACATPQGLQTPSTYLWNPQALVGRAVAVTAAAGATYTTATINGYDIYGYPMTEAITVSAGAQVLGKKAFKYIKSVVMSGGSADTTHAYSVDTTDIIGLPLRSDTFADVTFNYSASVVAPVFITSVTGYTVADKTVATATTGDVRGTYALQTAAATGANKIIARQSVPPQNVNSVTGLFGNAQFAGF